MKLTHITLLNHSGRIFTTQSKFALSNKQTQTQHALLQRHWPTVLPFCLTALLGHWQAFSSIKLSLKHMCLCPNSCIISCAKPTQSLEKQRGSGQVTGRSGCALTWRISNKAFEWASNALFSPLICAPFGVSTDQLLPVWWERKKWKKEQGKGGQLQTPLFTHFLFIAIFLLHSQVD